MEKGKMENKWFGTGSLPEKKHYGRTYMLFVQSAVIILYKLVSIVVDLSSAKTNPPGWISLL